MGAHVSRTDFEWKADDEPHASRRRAILQAHPEIKQLFGHDYLFKYIVTAMVFVQLTSFYLFRNLPWYHLLILAYCFGGVLNHSLTLAIHEIAHNLAFGHSRPLLNRAFGMFANLPIGVPMSISFKKYHLEHHRYQGDELHDTDIPTALEGKLFCTTFGKLCWLALQPFFYVLRPLAVHPMPPTRLEVINVAVQLTFDAVLVYFLGGRILAYAIGSTLLSMGLHPVAGHFVSEHYMFRKGFETYSYYGILNFITFNVGYHNEHHDFPYVPGRRLPMVKKIAPEFYDTMPQHHSWTRVLCDFVTDPAIGPYARIKRHNMGHEAAKSAQVAKED